MTISRRIIKPGPYETFYRLLHDAHYRPVEHNAAVEQAGRSLVCPRCGGTEEKYVERWQATMTPTIYGVWINIASCGQCKMTGSFSVDTGWHVRGSWREVA